MYKEDILFFYKLALLDLRDGTPVSELERAIDFYEDIENYEACAGILKAINEAQYLTITDIKQLINDTND